MAAITGISSASSLARTDCIRWAMRLPASGSSRRRKSLTSPPEMNAPSLPVSTTALSAESRARPSTTSDSVSIVSRSRAFLTSGRSMVTTQTPPSRSRRTAFPVKWRPPAEGTERPHPRTPEDRAGSPGCAAPASGVGRSPRARAGTSEVCRGASSGFPRGP